jgi:hypothetical protein
VSLALSLALQSHVSDRFSHETELRARGNLTFPPDTDMLTIREWFNNYSRSEMRDIYIAVPTGVGRIAKGMAFSLELFIHVDRVSNIKFLTLSSEV